MPIRIGVIWGLTRIFLLTHRCKPLFFCLCMCLLVTLAFHTMPVGFEWGWFLPGVVNHSTNNISCSTHSCDNHHSICLFFGFWRRGFGRPWGIPRTSVPGLSLLPHRGGTCAPHFRSASWSLRGLHRAPVWIDISAKAPAVLPSLTSLLQCFFETDMSTPFFHPSSTSVFARFFP